MLRALGQWLPAPRREPPDGLPEQWGALLARLAERCLTWQSRLKVSHIGEMSLCTICRYVQSLELVVDDDDIKKYRWVSRHLGRHQGSTLQVRHHTLLGVKTCLTVYAFVSCWTASKQFWLGHGWHSPKQIVLLFLHETFLVEDQHGPQENWVRKIAFPKKSRTL